ncbi:hypothetical protein [Maribacter aestuarii]|uniref:hypothetical protein n=1 Tax=Maribacter aestuarii TaxID=1130723 RepID=UPI00248B8F79|nr:hypothetical protein [Maribacter aestuarii]
MEFTLLTKEPNCDSIENFMDFYYSLRLRFLASDLLYKGLTPKQISDAVLKAVNVGKSSGMNIRAHFKPVFSSIEKEIITDCKLSRLGYGLVLMNAETKLSVVGKWQLEVLEDYLAKAREFES